MVSDGFLIGGIFFWIGAISILLPLNISKFEIGVTDFPVEYQIRARK